MFFVYYFAQGADMNEKTTAVLRKIKVSIPDMIYVAMWILVAVALLLDVAMVAFWLIPG